MQQGTEAAARLQQLPDPLVELQLRLAAGSQVVHHSMALGFGGKSAQLASYFEEVAAHFATLEDAEEKSLLAANAIEEV